MHHTKDQQTYKWIDSWSNKIEVILENIRINCVNMSNYHNEQHHFYRSVLLGFRIPLIILSAINSFSAVGLSEYTSQQNVSIINALISLFCGIVTSVELLLNIQKKMETELSSQKDYYKLGIEIFKVLNLDREKRMTDAKTFLDEKFSDYQKLMQGSNAIKTHKNYFIDRLTPLPPELVKTSNFLNFNLFRNDTPSSLISNELTIIPANNSDEEDKNTVEENFYVNGKNKETSMSKTKLNNHVSLNELELNNLDELNKIVSKDILNVKSNNNHNII
jgi:hypothetical protein